MIYDDLSNDKAFNVVSLCQILRNMKKLSLIPKTPRMLNHEHYYVVDENIKNIIRKW